MYHYVLCGFGLVVELGLLSSVSRGIYICLVYFLNHNRAFVHGHCGMCPFSYWDFLYLELSQEGVELVPTSLL